MGVTNLWQILKPRSVDQKDLSSWCMHNAVVESENLLWIEPRVVGIDASIWIHECQAAFFNPRHSQMGENPELHTLFYRLADLLRMCIIPVFIFDGLSRPAKKRGKNVVTQPHWLTDRFKEFIDAFGFYSYTAPGEAEAELAFLNKTSRIDAVLSKDSDALVFDLGFSFTNTRDSIPTEGKTKNLIHVYHSDCLEVTRTVRLQRKISAGGLLLYTLLSGGDYDGGVPGCGSNIACGLALSGLGDELLRAVQYLPSDAMEFFLVDWRSRLCWKLTENTCGCLQSRHPAVAQTVPTSFPDLEVVRLYTSPITSIAPFVSEKPWINRNANLRKLSQLCNQTFSWQVLKIENKFERLVWIGVCFRQVVEIALIGDTDDPLVPSTLFQTVRHLPIKRYEPATCNIKINISPLNWLLPIYVKDSKLFERSPLERPSYVTMKLPMNVARHYLPHLFEKMLCKSRKVI